MGAFGRPAGKRVTIRAGRSSSWAGSEAPPGRFAQEMSVELFKPFALNRLGRRVSPRRSRPRGLVESASPSLGCRIGHPRSPVLAERAASSPVSPSRPSAVLVEARPSDPPALGPAFKRLDGDRGGQCRSRPKPSRAERSSSNNILAGVGRPRRALPGPRPGDLLLTRRAPTPRGKGDLADFDE